MGQRWQLRPNFEAFYKNSGKRSTKKLECLKTKKIFFTNGKCSSLDLVWGRSPVLQVWFALKSHLGQVLPKLNLVPFQRPTRRGWKGQHQFHQNRFKLACFRNKNKFWMNLQWASLSTNLIWSWWFLCPLGLMFALRFFDSLVDLDSSFSIRSDF